MRINFREKIIGLMLMLFVSVSLFATTPSPAIVVKKVNAKAFSLYVKTLDDNSTVEIKDEAGELILKEVLAKGYVYRKTYDVSSLPVGNFTVKISDNFSTKIFMVLENEIKLILDENKNLEEKK
jgi:hypothetical protein